MHVDDKNRCFHHSVCLSVVRLPTHQEKNALPALALEEYLVLLVYRLMIKVLSTSQAALQNIATAAGLKKLLPY